MALRDPARFFDACRAGVMGPTLDQGEVDGVNAVLAAFDGEPLAFAAYGLATAWHETAHTMRPVKELGGERYFTRMYDPASPLPGRCAMAKRNGNTEPGDGARYCGRGLVQLTWKNNYRRAGSELGLDLVGDPALALSEPAAAKILCDGMEQGWFSGKSLGDYLPRQGPAARQQFCAARRIVNGQDRAALVASYALAFQQALEAGGWA